MEVLDGHAWLTMCDWGQIPHLDEDAKATLLASYPAYQRDARSKGIPSLGSGAIYRVPESDYVIPDIEIPPHWPRAYGLDVGWRVTAAVFGALNRDTDTLYLYSEYYRKEAEPVIHAESIKARGKWIVGAIDPAARGRGQTDGRNLLEMYRDLGLDLVTAENSVETGIYEVLMRLSSGRLKIFRSLQNLLGEIRLYRRDEKGRVVKDNDHGVDAVRYLVMELLNICKTAPSKSAEREEPEWFSSGGLATSWMG